MATPPSNGGSVGDSFDPISGSIGRWVPKVTDTFFAGFDGKTATLEFEQVDDSDIELVQRNLRRGDELLAVEEVESTDTEGEVLWALSDHLGTVRDIGAADDDGQFEIVNHRVFDSFGVITSETNPEVELAYGFTGRWTDAVSGLTHHLNRWYDPSEGKWLSEDPIGFAAGDVNLHRYVGNSVNNLVDLDGLKAAGPLPQDKLTDADPYPDEAYDRARENLGPEFFENYKNHRDAYEENRSGSWAWLHKRNLAQLDRTFNNEVYLQSKVMQLEQNPLGALADNTHPLNMHNIIGAVGAGKSGVKGYRNMRGMRPLNPGKGTPPPTMPPTRGVPAEPRTTPTATPAPLRPDLARHLMAQDTSVARRNGVGGAHNVEAFIPAYRAIGARIKKVTRHPTVPGITKVEYQIPIPGQYKAKIFVKTVYNPKVISHAEMLQFGTEAANNAQSHGNLTREWTGTATNGLRFRGYLDAEGNVRSLFPEF